MPVRFRGLVVLERTALIYASNLPSTTTIVLYGGRVVEEIMWQERGGISERKADDEKVRIENVRK
jgi:hypothetical protein